MSRTRGTNGTEENCILLIGKPEINHLKNIGVDGWIILRDGHCSYKVTQWSVRVIFSTSLAILTA